MHEPTRRAEPYDIKFVEPVGQGKAGEKISESGASVRRPSRISLARRREANRSLASGQRVHRTCLRIPRVGRRQQATKIGALKYHPRTKNVLKPLRIHPPNSRLSHPPVRRQHHQVQKRKINPCQKNQLTRRRAVKDLQHD